MSDRTKGRDRQPPFLTEALSHSIRIAEVLSRLPASTRQRPGQRWLVGRTAEVQCLTDAVMDDWRHGRVTDVEATQSINAYIQLLHRGLALHFGELAPSCCISSLVITASPVSYADITRSLPAPTRPPSGTVVEQTSEIGDEEILDITDRASLVVEPTLPSPRWLRSTRSEPSSP
jgi:hypothetical protein